MKVRGVHGVVLLASCLAWHAAIALAGPLPAGQVAAPQPLPSATSGSVSSDEEQLLAKTTNLKSDTYGKTLTEAIRGLKTPARRRAACLYVLAIVGGDVGAFMELVPPQGLVIEKKETKTKEKVSRAEMQRRARASGQDGRPSFGGVLNEVADVAPRALDWGVQMVKGRLVISANGAFAWATLGSTSDGRFLIEKITISFNND